ncbi:MAG: SDR family NAD(P)-dependent oxidoreductase, partial [Steroidobacteraceae bacterium]|nr:SDR family NAD(P)-dependent oxidoreductase [Steroidobacteraceae bacterium]
MPTVLITGASRGLGLEMVRQYAQAAWDVIATCRNPHKAEELQQLRRRWSGSVLIDMLDVTHPAQIESLAGKYASTPIDLLINNAGELGPRGAARELIHKQYFGSLDYESWLKVLEVNTLGPVRVAETFAEQVERSAQKKMIFISSTMGSNVAGDSVAFAYCSSKAALNKCVTMLARALRSRGIVVAAVCPGHVKTAMG